MGDRYARVNVRVEQETKERWDRFVDESDNYSTLSQLIRTTVNAEVEREQSGDGSDSDDVMGMSSEEFDDLLDHVKQVEEQVVEVREGVRRVEERGSVPREAKGQDPRAYPSGEVFEALPDGNGPSDGVSIEELAEQLSYGEAIVGHATRLVEQQSGRVQVDRSHDGTAVYWKEV